MSFGIKWKGPTLDPSGYGTANRDYVDALYRVGTDITVQPWNFENKSVDFYGEQGKLIESLKNKDIDYDVVVHHYVPNRPAPEAGKFNVGYNTWETDSLPDNWVDKMNRSFDLVLVPSHFNKEVYRNSGVKVPVEVVPHCLDTSEFEIAKPAKIPGFERHYKFLSVFQWTERKNPIGLLKAYFTGFYDRNDVVLVLKTYGSSTSKNQRDKIKQMIESVKKDLRFDPNRLPPIYFLGDLISRETMTSVYKGCDCFVLPCFSEDTQIMTTNGLKGIDDVKVGEKVLTINPNTGYIEKDRVKNKWIKKYEGEMLHFKTSKIDKLVTPNHRIYYHTPKKRKQLSVEKAEFFKKRNARYYIPITSYSKGIDEKYIDTQKFIPSNGFFNTAKQLPSKIRTKDLMKIIGWYISEGSIDCHTRGYRIVIANTNEKYLKEIENIFSNLGLNYRRNTDTRNTNLFSGVVSYSHHLFEILKTCGHGWHEKTIPNWVLCYSPKYLKILLHALLKGDGHFGSNNNTTYYTSSKLLRDKIIELCWKIGYSTNVCTRLQNDRKINNRNIKKEDTHINYAIGISKEYTNGTFKTKEHLTTEKYKGRVWCVETENQTVIAYRNGKTFLSGNSRGEGFGLPFAEALAANMQVVAPKQGGQIDILEPQELTGYLPCIHGQWTPVSGMPWIPNYNGLMNWYDPNILEFRDMMIEAEEMKTPHTIMQPSEHMTINFNHETVGTKFYTTIEKYL